MNRIIKSLDMVDWCMVALIIALLGTMSLYAHYYENMSLLSGAAIGDPMGALACALGVRARWHKEAANGDRKE